MENELKNRRAANAKLWKIGKSYHQAIPLGDIDSILEQFGFKATEPAIYCGRKGESHEQVGVKSYLHMSWYRMEETGRYEVIAYLS